MKQWKCTCGYRHTGEAPPERCPVCNAPQSEFIYLLQDVHSDEEESICSAEFSEGCKHKEENEQQ